MFEYILFHYLNVCLYQILGVAITKKSAHPISVHFYFKHMIKTEQKYHFNRLKKAILK